MPYTPAVNSPMNTDLITYSIKCECAESWTCCNVLRAEVVLPTMPVDMHADLARDLGMHADQAADTGVLQAYMTHFDVVRKCFASV